MSSIQTNEALQEAKASVQQCIAVLEQQLKTLEAAALALEAAEQHIHRGYPLPHPQKESLRKIEKKA